MGGTYLHGLHKGVAGGGGGGGGGSSLTAFV